MFKKLNKKGFTLAELLIVVAIIGVLVAISIPIFTGQLAKAKYAADLANARSVYAQMTADYLTHESGQSYMTAENITENSGKTITVKDSTGATNQFKFSGIVAVTFTPGTDTTAPKVEVGACTKAGVKDPVVFGGESTKSGT